jgi:hypothetical protein
VFKHKLRTYLDSEATSVNIIPKEKVVCLRQVATNFKNLHEVILGVCHQDDDKYKESSTLAHELSMNVTNNYTKQCSTPNGHR